jgi:hypothetical protein
MDESAPANMMDIYTEYIRLRRDGWSADAVVKTLRSLAEQLDQNGLAQLNTLVTQWENREGGKYTSKRRLAGAAEPAAPPRTGSAPGRSSVVRPLAPPPARGAHPDDDAAGAFGDSAPSGKLFCPRCGRPNRAGDNYCFACGHMLQGNQVGTTRIFSEKAEEQQTRWGTAYLGAASQVLLVVRGGAKPVRVDLGDQDVTLGRTSPDNPIRPDIDLAPFNAEELGVSRVHASLRRAENTVQITDLSSRNFTYLNGQRVYPRESRVLRHGDEVRLGRLPLTVIFKHADR